MNPTFDNFWNKQHPAPVVDTADGIRIKLCGRAGVRMLGRYICVFGRFVLSKEIFPARFLNKIVVFSLMFRAMLQQSRIISFYKTRNNQYPPVAHTSRFLQLFGAVFNEAVY